MLRDADVSLADGATPYEVMIFTLVPVFAAHDEETVTAGDLSVYDSIVVGIYAYAAPADLAASNARLHRYVREGGNLLVQYHRPSDNWDPETTALFPLELGSPSFSWRVTDENAPVTYLEPENPLLNTPNAITEADWAGWVKDRGLYFPSEWDDACTALLSMGDPGEEPGSFSRRCRTNYLTRAELTASRSSVCSGGLRCP